jgi:hypothetical protein
LIAALVMAITELLEMRPGKALSRALHLLNSNSNSPVELSEKELADLGKAVQSLRKAGNIKILSDLDIDTAYSLYRPNGKTMSCMTGDLPFMAAYLNLVVPGKVFCLAILDENGHGLARKLYRYYRGKFYSGPGYGDLHYVLDLLFKILNSRETLHLRSKSEVEKILSDKFQPIKKIKKVEKLKDVGEYSTGSAIARVPARMGIRFGSKSIWANDPKGYGAKFIDIPEGYRASADFRLTEAPGFNPGYIENSFEPTGEPLEYLERDGSQAVLQSGTAEFTFPVVMIKQEKRIVEIESVFQGWKTEVIYDDSLKTTFSMKVPDSEKLKSFLSE